MDWLWDHMLLLVLGVAIYFLLALGLAIRAGRIIHRAAREEMGPEASPEKADGSPRAELNAHPSWVAWFQDRIRRRHSTRAR